MLYRTALLRAFSASLLISVLTACGGGGSGGGDGTTPTTSQPANDNGSTGDTSGTSDTSGAGTDTTTGDTTGTTSGTGDTNGTGTTGGTGDTAGTGSTGGTGDTSGTGNTGGGTTGNTGGNTSGNADASGVWKLDIPATFIASIEKLNHVGIVDEWLPGSLILMADHGTSIDVSTCIDNANLPATQVMLTKVAGVYEATADWTFNGVPVTPSVIRQSDGSFVLKLMAGIFKLADIPAHRQMLNNQFVLQGTGIASVDSTNLTCAIKTPATDGSKTLSVTTWYEDSFLYLTFPAIADVGHYDYDVDEVSLNSEPLYYLIDTTVASAQLDLSLYEPGKLKLDFDLQTADAVQLHGEVTLQENPLSASN